MIVTVIVFIFILSLLVLIHEAGHFFVAKKLGIKVEEFGFGLPPRLFGIKRGETIYSLNWLPIGGFVKLYGEDEAGGGGIKIKNQKLNLKDKDIGRAFFVRSPLQKALVVVAGVVMNAFLAVVVFYIFLFVSGFKTTLPLLSDYKFFGVNQRNLQEVIVNQIAKNSPAQKAGIEPFSTIVSVNGQQISDSKNFIGFVNSHKGKIIELSWKDSKNKMHKAQITPRLIPPKGEGALGVALFSVASAQLSYDSPTQKILSGVVHPVNLMLYNFDVIGNLIKVSLKEKSAEPLSQGVSGPVGIASITGSILKIPDVKEKILGLLNLVGVLSISLAFFNVLPIPALDGGRLFFIAIEGIFRKKVSSKIEGYIHAGGMVVLLGLILLITFKDVTKLFIK